VAGAPEWAVQELLPGHDLQIQRQEGAISMVYTEYHNLTNKELVLLASAKVKLTPLEQELLNRLTQYLDAKYA
jgi:hypothetical protein